MYHLLETHFESERHDFKEMLIHHLVTIALCFGCYITNIHGFGFMISHVHDHADVTTSLLKISAETIYNNLMGALATINIFVWGYTRCVVYPILLYQGWWISMEPNLYPDHAKDPKQSEIK